MNKSIEEEIIELQLVRARLEAKDPGLNDPYHRESWETELATFRNRYPDFDLSEIIEDEGKISENSGSQFYPLEDPEATSSITLPKVSFSSARKRIGKLVTKAGEKIKARRNKTLYDRLAILEEKVFALEKQVYPSEIEDFNDESE